jgi:hypothetical protein
MNTESVVALETATIRQQRKALHLPAVAAQCAQVAEQAVRERRTHLGYLEALLQAQLEPASKLATARALRAETAHITLGSELKLGALEVSSCAAGGLRDSGAR